MLAGKRANRRGKVTYSIILVSDGGDRANRAVSDRSWALSNCVDRSRVDGGSCGN